MLEQFKADEVGEREPGFAKTCWKKRSVNEPFMEYLLSLSAALSAVNSMFCVQKVSEGVRWC